MILGSYTHNQEAGAADRPELFQKADAAEAGKAVAEYRCATSRSDLDCVAFRCARLASVLKRAIEQSARSLRNAMRGMPCSDSGRIFGESGKFSLSRLP